MCVWHVVFVKMVIGALLYLYVLYCATPILYSQGWVVSLKISCRFRAFAIRGAREEGQVDGWSGNVGWGVMGIGRVRRG